MVGTFFGVLTIGVLRNGLTLMNVSPFWVQFVQGAVIFVPYCWMHWVNVIDEHTVNRRKL